MIAQAEMLVGLVEQVAPLLSDADLHLAQLGLWLSRLF